MTETTIQTGITKRAKISGSRWVTFGVLLAAVANAYFLGKIAFETAFLCSFADVLYLRWRD